MRAVSDDQMASMSIGISIPRVFGLAWAMAGFSAAAAGAIIGNITGLNFETLHAFGIIVFPVVILGGLDSIFGAVVAGIIMGLIQQFAAGYLDGHWGLYGHGQPAAVHHSPGHPALQTARACSASTKSNGCNHGSQSVAGDRQLLHLLQGGAADLPDAPRPARPCRVPARPLRLAAVFDLGNKYMLVIDNILMAVDRRPGAEPADRVCRADLDRPCRLRRGGGVHGRLRLSGCWGTRTPWSRTPGR